MIFIHNSKWINIFNTKKNIIQLTFFIKINLEIREIISIFANVKQQIQIYDTFLSVVEKSSTH